MTNSTFSKVLFSLTAYLKDYKPIIKEIEINYREEVSTLTEKYSDKLKSPLFNELITLKEIEIYVGKFKQICFRKTEDFFKEQYEMLKFNNIMKEETNSSGKLVGKNGQVGSSNSDEIDSSGSNSRTKSRKNDKSNASECVRPNRMSAYAKNILESWVEHHIDDPYPTKEEKILLASKTNLTLRQVRAFILQQGDELVCQS
jgi:hypothetical protein